MAKDSSTNDRAKFFAITNSNCNSDGAGAQLQRVFSVYCYAKAMRASFIFSKIEHLEVQHGDSFSSSVALRQFISDLNQKIDEILHLEPSLNFAHQQQNSKKISIKSNLMSLFLLMPLMKLYASLFRKHILVVLDECYKFTNLFPNVLLKINPKDHISEQDMSKEIDIQIHIRMSTLSHLSDRFVSTTYYLDWIQFVKSLCEVSSVPYKIGIHTDCDLAKLNLSLVNENLTIQTHSYWQSIGILDAGGNFNYDLLANYQELVNLIKAEVQKVEIFSGMNALESWEIMRKAHVLFTSRSSFSFVGALLASNTVIVAPRMTTSGPSTWIISDKISDKSKKKLKNRLQNLKLIK